MTESPANNLIWIRPEPDQRRPGLSRELIARAALSIADAEGFEAVTMKRIATELGAGTMTLYYYVRTKSDVVALMQDAILTDVLLPDDAMPTNWRAAVAEIARKTRDVLLAHPWSTLAFQDAQFGPNAMRHIEQSLAALDSSALSGQKKLALLAIVDDYVAGNVLHSVESLGRAAAARNDPALVADAVAFGQQQIATGEFPRLAALSEQSAPSPDSAAGPPMTADALTAQFEQGLEALLDGLEVRTPGLGADS